MALRLNSKLVLVVGAAVTAVLMLLGVFAVIPGWRRATDPVRPPSSLTIAAPPRIVGSRTLPAFKRDGALEFTVSYMECNTVGESQLCLIAFFVRNTGIVPVIYRIDDQKAFDANGVVYAAWWPPDEKPLDPRVVPAGAILVGYVYFRTPLSVKPTVVELHESSESAGVGFGISETTR